MAFLVSSGAPVGAAASRLTPAVARVLIALVVATSFGLAIAFDPAGATAAIRDAGDDLTHLLRAMAILKAAMAAGLVGAILWRLGVPIGPPRLLAYAASGAAMAAGPPLMWGMAHLGLGALLLHAGLLSSVLLLWKDQAVGAKLSDMIAARRSRRT